MNKKVEFFFDVGSPTAYLAYTQLPSIAIRASAEIVWRPILLGGLFKAVGNQSPAFLAPKSAWMASDLPRFASRYGVPYRKNDYFPINTLSLMRGAVAAMQEDILESYLAVGDGGSCWNFCQHFSRSHIRISGLPVFFLPKH